VHAGDADCPGDDAAQAHARTILGQSSEIDVVEAAASLPRARQAARFAAKA
jgi:hypothetical protein